MARPYPNTERMLEMAELYRSGLTLAAIGVKYGVTRERVRQCVKKCGLTRTDSIRYSITRAQEVDRAMRMEQRCLAKWGITAAEWRVLRPQRTAYRGQRRNARVRGIEWAITFPEWWALWEASGRWSERRQGGYCMARVGDRGGYSADNVYICTVSKNIKDGWLNKPAHTRKIRRGPREQRPAV